MKDTRVFLQHIFEQSEILIDLSGKITYDEFVESHIYTNAAVRSLEIIGEAAKNVPQEYRMEHPNIPWRGMTGLRDRLIHKYFAVDTIYVWEIITKEIPVLKREIEKLLKSAG